MKDFSHHSYVCMLAWFCGLHFASNTGTCSLDHISFVNRYYRCMKYCVFVCCILDLIYFVYLTSL